jgi:tetratricopeptide (TPR) repeat protein
MGCRRFSETTKLPFNNPDRSLAFFGLGEVLYEMQEWGWAARCFLKAREIREDVLGLEHVQTATVFNNLACCFCMLGRLKEALGYAEIAEVVLGEALGEMHERTLTCCENLRKIRRTTIENQPEYRKMWEVFEEDQFEKKKKSNEGKGKKK